MKKFKSDIVGEMEGGDWVDLFFCCLEREVFRNPSSSLDSFHSVAFHPKLAVLLVTVLHTRLDESIHRCSIHRWAILVVCNHAIKCRIPRCFQDYRASTRETIRRCYSQLSSASSKFYENPGTNRDTATHQPCPVLHSPKSKP